MLLVSNQYLPYRADFPIFPKHIKLLYFAACKPQVISLGETFAKEAIAVAN